MEIYKESKTGVPQILIQSDSLEFPKLGFINDTWLKSLRRLTLSGVSGEVFLLVFFTFHKHVVVTYKRRDMRGAANAGPRLGAEAAIVPPPGQNPRRMAAAAAAGRRSSAGARPRSG